MAIHKLNAKVVESAKPQEKEYNLSDGGGLALRVKPNGSKFWIFNYTAPVTKKRKNMGLGSFPDVSLSKARERHKKYKALVVDNIDPIHQRQLDEKQTQELHLQTFEAVALMWFDKKKAEIKAKTAQAALTLLENHAFPAFGNEPISQLKAFQVIELLRPIEAKGNLETVKRVSQRINEVMVHAVNCGLIEANPLTNIRQAFQTPKKASMPSIGAERLPELMSALNRASIKLTTRCLIEWQLHTMTRPNEAATAKWQDIDFNAGVWIIPAEQMKKGIEQRIPLTPQTLTLLDVMKPISQHREYLFPADRDPRNHTNEQTANAALKRMGFKGELVAHGMRSLASTTLNAQGFDSDVIEAALAHIDGNEVRRAYNRTDYFERRKKMMYWWSEFIESAAQGSSSLAGYKGLKVM